MLARGAYGGFLSVCSGECGQSCLIPEAVSAGQQKQWSTDRCHHGCSVVQVLHLPCCFTACLAPPGSSSLSGKADGGVRTTAGLLALLTQESEDPRPSPLYMAAACSSFIPIPVSKTTEKCPQSQAADATQPP
ncbi:hypothetical protein FQA47_020944 [Oryzias melastigma]|uniref:Uncharacterized protein n=1 Tax=Oryzias melastigma TaxID=30732 RepID=A0A834CM63_ORYME|nr:hypothetical protein FQA47_020944 [Oryzias melastigma]